MNSKKKKVKPKSEIGEKNVPMETASSRSSISASSSHDAFVSNASISSLKNDPQILTRRELLKKKRPLLASRSLLRIGLFRNRKDSENLNPEILIANELPSENAAISREKSIMKARKKMTKRASSLSDFFHYAKTNDNTSSSTKPLLASSLAAAAMSAYRRNSRPFSITVSQLSQEKITSKEKHHKHSSASSSAASSLCCSALLKNSKKHGNNQTHNNISNNNKNHKKERNASEYSCKQELITPEYGGSFPKLCGTSSPKRALLRFGGDIIKSNSNDNYSDYYNKGESIIISAISTPNTTQKREIPDPENSNAMEHLPTTLPTRLRRLSKAFFNSQNGDGDRFDLMNDWEIGGTQNPWICPSDRHLQLRAQLKSGWSVRTASARSPTNSKQNLGSGTITDAEQEHIRKVLARADQGRQNEELRIGKMVDRLEKLRTRATGNGVTQCFLCSTEFGLLASKSYAAMCSDCRKYVCQKNCGIETYDQKRGEPIFLCKICSEYREVMWKKSGAWFYREMPNYTKPADAPLLLNSSGDIGGGSKSPSCNGTPYLGGAGTSGNRSSGALPLVYGNGRDSPQFSTTSPLSSNSQNRWRSNRSGACLPGRYAAPQHDAYDKISMYEGDNTTGVSTQKDTTTSNTTNNTIPPTSTGVFGLGGSILRMPQRNLDISCNGALPVKPLPIPTDQQQRLKTTPRPRITPSWVHEKIQSSISVGSDEEDDEEEDEDEIGNGSGSASTSSLDILPAISKEVYRGSSAKTTFKTSTKKEVNNQSSNNSHKLNQNSSNSHLEMGTSGTSRKHYSRPRDLQQPNNAMTGGSTSSSASASRKETKNLAKFILSNRNRITDTEESENDESRRSTPSTSPRHSIATPSSYGGDDLSQNHTSINANETTFDVKSIDSGVVQSDHSAQQALQHNNNLIENNSCLNGPPPPSSSMYNCYASPPTSSLQQNSIAASIIGNSLRSLTLSPANNGRNLAANTNSSSPIPPPIPPRSSTAASTNSVSMSHAKRILTVGSPKRPSSAASAISSSLTATVSSLTSPSNNKNRDSIANLMTNYAGGGPTELNRNNRLPKQSYSNSSRPESVHSSDYLMTSSSHELLASGPTIASGSLERLKNSTHKQHNSYDTSKIIRESPHKVMANTSNNLDLKQDTDSPSPTFMSSPEGGESSSVTNSTLGSVQFNLTYLPEEKQLIIYLIRAKNLRSMDRNGMSDPYVKLHLIPGNVKATKLTSKTIEKTLNPEWHEEMIYYGITEDERLRKTLRLTILDRDRIGSDFLGQIRIALKKLPLGATRKFNLYLEDSVAPLEIQKTEDSAERGKILISICYNIQQGSLFVNIKRCAELLGMDSTGFSDPYCKISLTPMISKSHRQRTSIKKRTLNPEFNSTLQFIVPFKDLPKKTLEVGVYDHDVARHDDYIGGVVLSTTAKDERGKQWQQCIENPGKTFEYWHKLEID